MGCRIDGPNTRPEQAVRLFLGLGLKCTGLGRDHRGRDIGSSSLAVLWSFGYFLDDLERDCDALLIWRSNFKFDFLGRDMNFWGSQDQIYTGDMNDG